MKINSDGFTWSCCLYGFSPLLSCVGVECLFSPLKLHQSVSNNDENRSSRGWLMMIYPLRKGFSILRSLNFVCRVMLAYFLIINHFTSIPPSITNDVVIFFGCRFIWIGEEFARRKWLSECLRWSCGGK
jgi:hypothetical protein